MKHLIEALCRLWDPAWQGMVMGKLTYKKGRGKGSGELISKVSHHPVLSISISDKESHEYMNILLFPFKEMEGEKGRGDGKAWRSFTADEVREYSRRMGDHNEIHQSSHPVVSGFQLAEELGKDLPFSSCLKIRFHHPVYSGETICLKANGPVILGYTDDLCFKVERK